MLQIPVLQVAQEDGRNVFLHNEQQILNNGNISPLLLHHVDMLYIHLIIRATSIYKDKIDIKSVSYESHILLCKSYYKS